MSILSNLLAGKITLATALAQAEAWLGQTAASIEKSVAGDPAVQSAVGAAIADGKAAINVGADWAGTAISGGLSDLAADIAPLVAKYAAQLAGEVGAPLSAAAVTVIQALGQVGVAAVQHEVANLVAGDPPQAAAAPPA
jgi:hypothetical protein